MAIGGRERFGQLLLFTALLLGIATMHTMGHPAPGHGGGTQEPMAASSAVSSAAHASLSMPRTVADASSPSDRIASTDRASTATDLSPSPTGPGASATGLRATSSMPVTSMAVTSMAVTSAGLPGASGPGDPAYAGPELPGMSMDPMTVCLAVVDTFTLVLLAVGLLRTDPVALLAAFHARILRALRTDPRPRRSLLASLSVLRI